MAQSLKKFMKEMKIMGLLISQGKVIANNYEIIERKDVICQITKVELHKTLEDCLKITLKILDGNGKGRIVFDTINFNPKHKMAWRFGQLRKAVGKPYKEGEPATVDAEALFLHKAVKCDLGKRVDRNGKEWQNVTNYTLVRSDNIATATPVNADDDDWSDSVETENEPPF